MDSDSDYLTTYSEDQRIEKSLAEIRKARRELAKQEDLERQELFKKLSEAKLDLFVLPGLKFYAFRHTKIKFSFLPSDVTNLVNKNVKFFVSLKYRENYWCVKRDSLPANYKWKVYKIFYDQAYFAIDDENIIEALMKIYEILVKWTKSEENFRLNKFERYKQHDDDVELDSDDEQLFLSESERVELYQKRLKVLRRMVPPKK